MVGFVNAHSAEDSGRPTARKTASHGQVRIGLTALTTLRAVDTNGSG